MPKCSWRECAAEATKDQVSGNGEVWSRLCDAHDRELSEAMDKGPKVMLAAWAKAHGNKEAFAARMMGSARLASSEGGEKR